MITHLISTTEFVLPLHSDKMEIIDFIQNQPIDNSIFARRLIENYAHFISQKPTLEMFIGDKALFKNWEYDADNERIIGTEYDFDVVDIESIDTLEFFAYYFNLELTTYALKQLGL